MQMVERFVAEDGRRDVMCNAILTATRSFLLDDK